MPGLEETGISKAIISTYHDKLLSRIVNDLLMVEASHGLLRSNRPRLGRLDTCLGQRSKRLPSEWNCGLSGRSSQWSQVGWARLVTRQNDLSPGLSQARSMGIPP